MKPEDIERVYRVLRQSDLIDCTGNRRRLRFGRVPNKGTYLPTESGLRRAQRRSLERGRTPVRECLKHHNRHTDERSSRQEHNSDCVLKSRYSMCAVLAAVRYASNRIFDWLLCGTLAISAVSLG